MDNAAATPSSPSFFIRHKKDLILIGALLALSLLALLGSLLLRSEGSVVAVEIDGVRVAEYPLDLDGRYTLNDGTNVLVIENGEAYVVDSQCPDRTCERTGRIKYSGESIICLPNRVAVIIEGNAEDGVDFVS